MCEGRTLQHLHSLPPDLIDRVLLLLSVQELANVVLGCKPLRDGVERRLGSTLSTTLHQLCPRSHSPAAMCSFLGHVIPRLEMLETLDLSRSEVTDDLFSQLRENCIPNLRNLCLVACPKLSDRGVRCAAAVFPRLRYIDLTFSTRTTYNAVVYLRENCTDIDVIRRLPLWLQGKFVCPWGEVHTYYADGAFEFTRSEESKGYVRTLEEHAGFVQDSLQYINQPPWWPPMYRPGVLLKQIPGIEDEVLVAQRIQSLDPLTEFPEVALGQLEVGTTQILEAQLAMVSRMQVERFGAEEEVMPPEDLLHEILSYIAHAPSPPSD